ncbi:MAG TPA: S8 family serine peptidase, partial [Solirubrobacteraceae bacterium]|nr:S8 family serine peptidase [Solirubrobacteraceae bacterium]
VDVFAPGTLILSTYPSPAYAYLQGTSMASPNVAGVAALVLAARPGATALDVKSAIMASTEAKPDLAGKSVTGGRVNAERAVTGMLTGAPVNGTAPAITGTPRQGVALSASRGTWDPPGTSYGYTWQRSTDGGSSWTAVAGAASATYTPDVPDLGARLRVVVTATNPYGVAVATSAPVGPVTSGSPSNASPPVISGTPRRGQLLTVTSTWSPGGTYAYQWQRSTDGVSWTNIGANASSYTLTTAERDARIRVTVTATNAYGQASATSDAIGPVVWDPPVSTAAPVVTGTTQRTFTLTATAGAWDGSGNTFKYQWQRDGADIPGATAATYKLAKDDEGARVRVLVTATNPDATVTRASDATASPVSPFPPANTVAPLLSGTPQRGRTLFATRGTWTGPDNAYSYQWQRDFGEGYVDIAGATGTGYTLAVADVDATVRVVVTASNPDGTIMEASDPSAPVLAAGPLNQSPPTVSGSAQRGLTLVGAEGTWTGIGNSVSYQWQSSTDGSTWTPIPGATSATYSIGAGDVGGYLRLLVTVTNPDGTASAVTGATVKVAAAPPVNTAKPVVTGVAQRASTLSAGVGTWTGNGNAYTYQWQRDALDIPGATDPEYTVTAADVNAAIRVLVTAANPDGTATAASAPTAAIPSAPPVNTVRPSVSGTAQRGRTLTGTSGTWTGIGNSGALQWQSSVDGTTWNDIAGATGSTYAIAAGDVGNFLRLLVTVTNPDGTSSAASVATAKVTSAPPVNTVKPALSGTAERESKLTATAGTWSGIGNAYAYQWQRSADGASWVDIADATGATYTLTAAEVRTAVRVLVTATNPDGTVAAASAPTATIPSAPPVNTVRPALSGIARRGATLTATAGIWSGIGNSTSFQWQRSRDQGASWQAIDGATSATYVLTVTDIGAIVRMLVTTTNAEGSASQASTATAAVASDGPVSTSAPTIS